MTGPAVVFEEVSKFYGEVLGVNRVTLNIPPGITSLVGPNGSGKTTLMNLMTGLIHPDHGRILMRGISPRDPEALMRITGYATQYDTAPRWATGFTFITTGLLLFGCGRAEAEEKAWKARERLGWEPSVDFEGLVELLVDAELQRLRGSRVDARSAR